MRSLGIDTSNYTTSAALYCDGEVRQEKLLLPVKPGERGLRQSDAVFHHVVHLPQVLSPLLQSGEKLEAIGVSATPRSDPASYMPCFRAGVSQAETLGAALGVPIERFSHQQGHIASALYSAGKLSWLGAQFLAFHVSGGTTEALLVTPGERGLPETTCVGSSLDLKAGQAVDRVGLMLGLQFPCGKELEKLALQAPEEPITYRPVRRGKDCSLSGIENQCKKMVEQGQPAPLVARFCLEAVCKTLDSMCEALQREYPGLPVLFSGGVCANSILRKRLGEKYGASFAEPEFSCDNAVGPGILAVAMKEGSIWAFLHRH